MALLFSRDIICIVGRRVLRARRVVAPCLQDCCGSEGRAKRKRQAAAADWVVTECRVADCQYSTVLGCGCRLREGEATAEINQQPMLRQAEF